MSSADVDRLLENYPQIFFACHTRHVRDEVSGVVLSKHQVDILNHLDDVAATTLTELAEHMGVTPSTMSLATKRLVQEGYVRRERDVRDRRVIRLRLSEAGVRVKEASSVLDRSRVANLLSQLSEEEREAALHGLQLLARAARESMREFARHRGPGGRRLAG